MPHVRRVCILIGLLLTICVLTSSCTLLSHSGFLKQTTTIPLLRDSGLAVGSHGEIPYQRWRIPPWNDEMRYVWLAGDYDFRKHDNVELILYFHGMHSKDYYADFRKELERLAESRPNKPFLFVGFVDTPFLDIKLRSRERWTHISPKPDERPEKLFRVINGVYKAFRQRFPHIKKEKTDIVLAGFSGGGKVLDTVGDWLAKSPDQDPFAQVFRSRLRKIVYFDCWFDKNVVNTIPILLENNPKIKIVGTVYMKKPQEHAAMLVKKYNMKQRHAKGQLVGLNGRLTILHDDHSHWNAMISQLKDAL
jgi:hypothetical protein